jgi:hypothetical protein
VPIAVGVDPLAVLPVPLDDTPLVPWFVLVLEPVQD